MYITMWLYVTLQGNLGELSREYNINEDNINNSEDMSSINNG